MPERTTGHQRRRGDLTSIIQDNMIMAKRKAICPECNHQFTVHFNGVHSKSPGVRFRRTTEGQFETSIIAPGEMVEYERYYTMTDQLLVTGAVGIIAGTSFGYFASIPFHARDLIVTAQIITG